MAGLTVLVTGVTRYIGSALAGLLADQPGVDRVIGVDAALPEPAEVISATTVAFFQGLA